ncbi:MAG: DUF4230 domain-containing protein [Saprospiraceae bacterium]|nr:DUF4230 domain-containing protein [Saprospiraceae bacterium]
MGYQLAQYLNKASNKTETDQITILHSIRNVLKITTVEAEISELITQKTYSYFDISPFRKSVIIRVQAKAAAGFDLDSSSISVDELTKEVRIKLDLQPKILYLDQKVDYYDLQQGTFNAFTATELSQLNEKARDIILRSLDKTGILEKAAQRKVEILKGIQSLLSESGYQLKIEDQTPSKDILHQ